MSENYIDEVMRRLQMLVGKMVDGDRIVNCFERGDAVLEEYMRIGDTKIYKAYREENRELGVFTIVVKYGKLIQIGLELKGKK